MKWHISIPHGIIMICKELDAQLQWDLHHLLWRAEVYCLSGSEIEVKFQSMQDRYRALLEPDLWPELDALLETSARSVQTLISARKHLPNSGLVG